MTFDGDRHLTQPIAIGRDLHFIVVDLSGAKDTQIILARLNQCYPYAKNRIDRGVQNYLGEINADLVNQAVTALKLGDAAQLGLLMTQAQRKFDRYVAEACPQQLNAPKLHQLLSHNPLQRYTCGGKGVGSQGDGTAQFVVPDALSQKKAIAIIERDFPQMQCFQLNIPQQLAVKSQSN